MRLAAVAVLVPEHDDGIDRFTGALGVRLAADSQPGPGRRRVALARAAGRDQRAVIGRQVGGRVWLVAEIADFAAAHARMAQAGVVFLEPPRREAHGPVAVFEDPWGNRRDLIEPARP
jgi:catechol 2,3-dioxygenase-like lactoylglutathione lyase family enzyme